MKLRINLQKILGVFSKVPGSNNKNIRLYYLFSVIHESFFTEGNWIYLYLMYFSYAQLGILDALALGVGMLAEIPTGALADQIGKKKTIQLSFVTVLIAMILMCLATSSTMLYISNFIFFIGLALYSGASDAFVYDTILTANTKTTFDQVFAFSKSLKSIAFILAAGIGAIACKFNPRLPFILFGFMFLIGTIASLQITEPKTDTVKMSWKSYLKQNTEGLKQLFKPNLRPFVAFIFILLGMDYIYGWGFMKPAILLSFNFDSLSMGAIFVSYGIIIAIIINYLPKLRKYISDFAAVIFLSLGMIACFYIFTIATPVIGFLTAIATSIFGVFGYTWINIIINEKIPSNSRATTLSTVAMILKLPIIIVSPFAGAIIDNGGLHIFLFSFASLMLIGVIIAALKNRQLISQKPL